MEFLKDGTTLMAVDPSKDNLLVGIRISVSMKRYVQNTEYEQIVFMVELQFYARDEMPKEKKSLEDLQKQFSKSYALMFLILDELMYPRDLIDSEPGHDKMMEFIALGTKDDYRGKGIAGELVNQAIEVAVWQYLQINLD